jgi:anti-sigma B factor antagonist
VEIEVRSEGHVKLVTLRGKLNLGPAVEKLRETLDNAIDHGDVTFLFDLGEVPMIDSSGIGLLVRSLTSLKQRGGSLKLLNPSKMTRQTLKMIGLINLFEIFEDQGQALASFK